MRGQAGNFLKWAVVAGLLIFAVCFIILPLLVSPGLQFVVLIFLLIILWRLFKEQFEMSEGVALFLSLIIVYFVWRAFTLSLFFIIGILMILVVVRSLKS
ncbi:MAG: hypothetical protein GXO42_02725 [bacterium]|nr:hypothetical protein [bacterium]